MGFSLSFQINPVTFVPSQPTPSVKLFVICSLPCHVGTIILTKLDRRMGTIQRKHAADFCSSFISKVQQFFTNKLFSVEKHRSVFRVLKLLLLIILSDFIVAFFSRGFDILFILLYQKFQLWGVLFSWYMVVLFMFCPSMYLYLKWNPFRQNILRSYFKVQPDNLFYQVFLGCLLLMLLLILLDLGLSFCYQLSICNIWFYFFVFLSLPFFVLFECIFVFCFNSFIGFLGLSFFFFLVFILFLVIAVYQSFKIALELLLLYPTILCYTYPKQFIIY